MSTNKVGAQLILWLISYGLKFSNFKVKKLINFHVQQYVVESMVESKKCIMCSEKPKRCPNLRYSSRVDIGNHRHQISFEHHSSGRKGGYEERSVF